MIIFECSYDLAKLIVIRFSLIIMNFVSRIITTLRASSSNMKDMKTQHLLDDDEENLHLQI